MKAFLVSRYGIEVTEDDVRATIFAGLAGGAVEEDACLDLVEVVAILVIPLLVKVRCRFRRPDCSPGRDL